MPVHYWLYVEIQTLFVGINGNKNNMQVCLILSNSRNDYGRNKQRDGGR